LSFGAHPREITSVIGPNGAGKMTALNLICGFYKPASGVIQFGDIQIVALPSYHIARVGVARTYQASQLFATLPVLDNVLIALRRGRLGFDAFALTDRDPDRRALAESLLAFVGYQGSLDHPVGALSHADKRLVEIARALATRSAFGGRPSVCAPARHYEAIRECGRDRPGSCPRSSLFGHAQYDFIEVK